MWLGRLCPPQMPCRFRGLRRWRLKRGRAVTGRAGMISTAEECRRKAKEAEAMAEAARDQAAREIYTEVAKQWRTLADQVEKRGS